MAEGKSKTGVVKKRASKREKKDWIAAYIFIAPVTLGLLVFYIWPFIQNIWFSFNEVSKFNVATFCGLANYQKLFHDGEVLRTFGNTLKYVVVTVPVGLFLSILIAALLNSKIKGTSIYRTLYFLPSVTMAAAVAMVWKWIYNEKMGILNSAIRALGGKGIGWLTDPKIALYSVMIVGLWMSVGYNNIVKNNAEEFLGKGSFIFKENPSMGGEDFSFFVENCKGAFYHVGCGNKEKKITSLIHTEDFDIDERCLSIGAIMHVLNVLSFN